MANNRKFLFRRSFYEAARDMNDEDRVKFYDAIMEYGLYGKNPELDDVLMAAFENIKPDFDRKFYEIGDD